MRIEITDSPREEDEAFVVAQTREFNRQFTDKEEEAVRRGCRRVLLDTYSFQAPEFYRKLGFREFGRLEGFNGGHVRHFLCKDIG